MNIYAAIERTIEAQRLFGRLSRLLRLIEKEDVSSVELVWIEWDNKVTWNLREGTATVESGRDHFLLKKHYRTAGEHVVLPVKNVSDAARIAARWIKEMSQEAGEDV